MSNSRTEIKIENKIFEILWQDFGSKYRLTVFQNGKIFGSRDLGLLVDQSRGVVEYIIKSMLKEKTGLSKQI